MEGKTHPVPVTFQYERKTDGKEIYRTDPSVLRLVRGEAVTFNHPGKWGVTVFIPVPEIFEERGHVHSMQMTPRGMELTLHVRSDAPKTKGEFDYAVFSHDLKRFAVGNSPPRMILDDDTVGDRGGG